MQQNLQKGVHQIYAETLGSISVDRDRGTEGAAQADLREALLNHVFTRQTAGRLDQLIEQGTRASLQEALDIIAELRGCLPNGGARVPLTTSIDPNPNAVEQDKQSRPSWDPEFGTNLGPDRVPLQLNPGEQPVSWSLQPHGRFTPAIGPVSLPLAEYKGAILDLDGFLVNSEKPILQCILKGAKVLAREATGDQSYEFSVALVEEIKQRAFGKDDKNMTVALRAVLEERGLFPERCSKMEKEDFITHFREKRAEFFEAMIADGEFKELAGAIDFVKRLSAELDGKVAIFTGSPERNADLEISALGLDEYLPKQFRVYSTSLPAGRGKPEPDGFYMAREKLGLRDGDRWIGGGDRPNDYRAAIGSRDCGIFLGVPEDLDSNKYLKMVDDILNGAVQPSASPEKLRENILAGETKLVVTGGLGEDYIKFARSDR